METLAAAVARHPVELLVNSAGSGTFGPYLSADWDRTARMIDLNVAAYAGCLHLVARRMVEAGRGRIINIVSVAGFQPGPLMSAYYATKSYALSLSEALSVELAPRGVSVTALCPGPTSSPFHEAAGMTIPERDRRAMADAREIAAWGYRMARRGRHVAIHGAGFKTMVFLERFLPRRLVARMVGAMQRRRR
jgi:hypothetical protein